MLTLDHLAYAPRLFSAISVLAIMAAGCALGHDDISEQEPIQEQTLYSKSAKKTGKLDSGNVSFQGEDSGSMLRLNRLVYESGQKLDASLIVHDGRLTSRKVEVLVVAPQSEDVEVLTLKQSVSGLEYVSANQLTVKTGAPATLGDGILQTKPGELVYAMYYPDYAIETMLAGRANIVFDYGIIAVDKDPAMVPKVLPELAMTDDERTIPKGGKKIGTIVDEGGLPIQLPTNELIFHPTRNGDLHRFLAETGGKVLAVRKPDAQTPEAPPSYLVRVDPSKARMEHLPTMQSLSQEPKRLYGSSKEVLQLTALAMHYQMEGYFVSPNPRVQWMGKPETDDEVDPLQLYTDGSYEVDKAWVYQSVWEGDRTHVRVAFIDQGYAPNDDYRRDASGELEQCTLTTSGLDVSCGPGAAEGPPTTGASFFENRIWHGNLTVTTAGGVLNNGFGAQGVAGQVMVPMLYRADTASYAFEMGIGIEHAAENGASVINVSAGYPCALLNNIGVAPGICSPGERTSFCSSVALHLSAAALLICTIPPVGPISATILAIACGAAQATVGVVTGTCFSTLFAGDLRAGMQVGLDAAWRRGVPVVTSSGNVITLDPPLDSIVRTDVNDAGRWQMIPCTLDHAICVGAVDPSSMDNLHFNGDVVDIFAPTGARYWAPDDLNPMGAQGIQGPGTGTSVATAYVSGVIAMMQSLNPDLDPVRTGRTGDALRAIPGILNQQMRDTAHPPADDRGLVVNTLAAVRHTTESSIGYYENTLGYDNNLNYGGFEEPETDIDLGTLNAMRAHTDTIHYLRRGPADSGSGGTAHTDTDTFHARVPSTPGLYEVFVSLRTPDGYGRLSLDGTGFSPGTGSLLGPWDHPQYSIPYTTPLVFAGAEVAFDVRQGLHNSDAVYFVEARSVRRGNAPLPDRFDVTSPYNNTFGTAVVLGDESTDASLKWINTTPAASAGDRKVYRLDIPDLNFHQLGDVDVFQLSSLNYGIESGALTISVDPGVMIELYDANGRLLRSSVETVTIERDVVRDWPLYIMMRPEMDGAYAAYNLSLEYEDPGFFMWLGPPPEVMHGLRDVFLPRLIPASEDPFIQKLVDWAVDPAGRVMTPDDYRVHWNGGGDFRVLTEIREGQSALVRLLDESGKVVASAGTSDLQSGGGIEWGGNPAVMLEVPHLSKGSYILRLSHGKPGSQYRVMLPAGAVHNGGPTLEHMLGLGQGGMQ